MDAAEKAKSDAADALKIFVDADPAKVASGDAAAARRHFECVLDAQRRVCGAAHADTIDTLGRFLRHARAAGDVALVDELVAQLLRHAPATVTSSLI
jgi:hypothetical protein